MNEATHSRRMIGRLCEAAPLVLVPLWLLLLAGFFYQLVRAGLPAQ